MLFGRSKKYSTEAQLRQWAERQIKKGIPRQKICDDIMGKFDNSSLSAKAMNKLQQITEHNQACLNIERSIMQFMIDRNEQASKLEKKGKLKEAITLFEESVKDQFAGIFPYERLRIIYTKQERYKDAIRVCQAYINNSYLKGSTKESTRGFREKIQKLKEKLK